MRGRTSIPAACVAAALALAGATATRPVRAASAEHAVRLELEQAALPSRLGLERTLVAAAHAGSRTLVAGRMGHIYYSDNGGQDWSQAQVPVSVDLTSVHLTSPRHGWATGHDGVILRTDDGGARWTLMLDGRRAARAMLDYYQALHAAGTDVGAALDEARRFVDEDGARPFLDICFTDDSTGYAVGAWGLIMKTRDGGATWEPWLHRTDNPDALHLNAVRVVDGVPWIVGERGLMLRLDSASGAFRAVASPYAGTYFGLTATAELLVAFGLQGNAFTSRDRGATWTRAELPSLGGIAAGDVLADGRIALVDTSGGLWISADGGARFSRVPTEPPMPYYGIREVAPGRLLLVGMHGVRAHVLAAGAP